MTCAAFKRKFEKSGIFYIFNNSFLAITISRGNKYRGVIHQSKENSKSVRMISHVPHSNVNSRNRAYLTFLITVSQQ